MKYFVELVGGKENSIVADGVRYRDGGVVEFYDRNDYAPSTERDESLVVAYARDAWVSIVEVENY